MRMTDAEVTAAARDLLKTTAIKDIQAELALTAGTTYELDTLTLAGWTGPHDGLSCWDYFDASGRYKGPDADGIEPLFGVAE